MLLFLGAQEVGGNFLRIGVFSLLFLLLLFYSLSTHVCMRVLFSLINFFVVVAILTAVILLCA